MEEEEEEGGAIVEEKGKEKENFQPATRQDRIDPEVSRGGFALMSSDAERWTAYFRTELWSQRF
jgi:hypothetical protein